MLAAGARDVGAVLLMAPKAYPIAMNFGRFEGEAVGDRCVRMRCRDFPAFLETYQVGLVEGIFAHFGVAGRIRIAVEDIANATLEASWT